MDDLGLFGHATPLTRLLSGFSRCRDNGDMSLFLFDKGLDYLMSQTVSSI